MSPAESRPSPPPDPSPADQMRMHEMQHLTAVQEMAGVKAAAKTWGQTITGLVGLGGLVAVVQGDAQLSDLESLAQVVVSILSIVALVLAGLAIYLAIVAAQLAPDDGDSPAENLKKITTMTEVMTTVKTMTTAAHRQLKLSVIAAGGSLGCLIVVTVVFRMFQEDAGPPLYMVRYENGTVACGTMAWSDDDRLHMADGATDEIADMQRVDACPAR